MAAGRIASVYGGFGRRLSRGGVRRSSVSGADWRTRPSVLWPHGHERWSREGVLRSPCPLVALGPKGLRDVGGLGNPHHPVGSSSSRASPRAVVDRRGIVASVARVREQSGDAWRRVDRGWPSAAASPSTRGRRRCEEHSVSRARSRARAREANGGAGRPEGALLPPRLRRRRDRRARLSGGRRRRRQARGWPAEAVRRSVSGARDTSELL